MTKGEKNLSGRAPKTEVRINDINLEVAIRTFAHWRKQKSNATKLEEEAKAVLIDALDGYRKEHGEKGIFRTSESVSITVGSNAGAGHISGDELLMLGVSPEVIAKATKRTPYDTYQSNVVVP